MKLTAAEILQVLRKVNYPGFSRDIVDLGLVQKLEIDEGLVRFELKMNADDAAAANRIEREAREALQNVDGVTRVDIRTPGPSGGASSLHVLNTKPSAAKGGALDSGLIPEVRNTVAVASGKGGVGKSTVAVNLAVSLARTGASVGLLDADIYGPSVPIMMGRQGERPRFDAVTQRLLPFESYGVRFMSLGFMVDPDAAVIWRGPMVMKAIEQLLRDVDWGALDILIVDMPPGTGDAQLTLSQRVQLAGAVIVTTPQDVALADAIKGVAMFRKVDVPVLGLIENMSYFSCPSCDHRSEIFGHGGGRREAERLGVPFLGEVPLDPGVRSSGDSGTPLAASPEESATRAAFSGIAEAVLTALAPGQEQADAGGGIFDRFRKIWSPEKG